METQQKDEQIQLIIHFSEENEHEDETWHNIYEFNDTPDLHEQYRILKIACQISGFLQHNQKKYQSRIRTRIIYKKKTETPRSIKISITRIYYIDMLEDLFYKRLGQYDEHDIKLSQDVCNITWNLAMIQNKLFLPIFV